MIKKIIISIFGLLISHQIFAEQLMGGWTKQDIVTPESRKIANYAVNKSEGLKGVSSIEILKYSTQIVAGVNYKLTVRFNKENKEYCKDYVVYKNLNNELSITSQNECIKN